MLPIAAGILVFFVNNFLLTRLVTSLPGGTVLAPTTTAGLGYVALRARRPGALVLVYATYAALGTLGHLGVDASTYVLYIPRLLGAALAFDAVLWLCGFRRWALPLGLLPCAGILFFGAGLSVREWLVALLLAVVGLGAGVVLHETLHRRGDHQPGIAR